MKRIIMLFMIMAVLVSTPVCFADEDRGKDFIMNGLLLNESLPIRDIPRSKITEYLGKPQETKTEKINDTVTYTTLRYMGLIIVYYRYIDDPQRKEFVHYIES